MRTRMVLAILFLMQPGCVKKKHKSDPVTETGSSDSSVEVFRKSLQGAWEECQEKDDSSRVVRFTFEGTRLRLDTDDFLGPGCKGEQGELPAETFAMLYTIGAGQEHDGSYAFDYAVMDYAGNPSRTVYTSAKLSGNSILLMSLGALNGEAAYGDGRSAATRYRFSGDASNQKVRAFKRVID